MLWLVCLEGPFLPRAPADDGVPGEREFMYFVRDVFVPGYYGPTMLHTVQDGHTEHPLKKILLARVWQPSPDAAAWAKESPTSIFMSSHDPFILVGNATAARFWSGGSPS